MQFEGETLKIYGRSYTGTIYVETSVFNASFSFEQGDIRGTHHEIDIQHEPILFLADGLSGDAADHVNDRAGPALEEWLLANQGRVAKRFEIDVKWGE